MEGKPDARRSPSVSFLGAFPQRCSSVDNARIEATTRSHRGQRRPVPQCPFATMLCNLHSLGRKRPHYRGINQAVIGIVARWGGRGRRSNSRPPGMHRSRHSKRSPTRWSRGRNSDRMPSMSIPSVPISRPKHSGHSRNDDLERSRLRVHAPRELRCAAEATDSQPCK
jgi:hypothetical protein